MIRNFSQVRADSYLKFVYNTSTTEWQIQKTDLTDDTSFHDVYLDQVPAEAEVIWGLFYLADNQANSRIAVDKKGITDYVRAVQLRTQVANVPYQISTLLPVDGSYISMEVNPKPSDWTNINLKILGWIIR